MTLLDSDAEILRATPVCPAPLPAEQIRAAALLPDGSQRIETICRARFRKDNGAHYAVTDGDALAAEHGSNTAHLALIRQEKHRIRHAGERHVLDEPNAKVLPWSWSARLSCLLLRLVGVVSVFVCWNTVGSLVISSGVVDRFVEYPLLAFAYAFGTFAIAVGLEGAIGTMSDRVRRILFVCVLVGAVAAFAFWLSQVGGLVASANMTLEQLKRTVVSPADHSFSSRLLISQVATEMLAGILSWLSASRIQERHRLLTSTDNAHFNLLEEEEEKLDDKIRVSGRRLKEIETKREQLKQSEEEYVLTEVGRLMELREAARVRARQRDEHSETQELILHHGNNGHGTVSLDGKR